MVILAHNYRLGPFGFMALDALFPGQRWTRGAPLQWVRDNAAAGGGGAGAGAGAAAGILRHVEGHRGALAAVRPSPRT